MYAVIKTGGKQYRVSEGDRLRVETIAGEPGDELSLTEVLMLGNADDVTVGCAAGQQCVGQCQGRGSWA